MTYQAQDRRTVNASAPFNEAEFLAQFTPLREDEGELADERYPERFEGDYKRVVKPVNGRMRPVYVEQSADDCDALMQAWRWSRACADHADDFSRFHELLWADPCLDAWLAKTPVERLRAIWAAPGYRRPLHWAWTTHSADGCADARWRWLCAPIRFWKDGDFHYIPNGQEDAYCQALDYLLWDGRRRTGPRPDISALPPKGPERDRFMEGVHDLRDRWKDWKGTPWRVVAHARRASFAAWEKEWPARRAGERLTFEPPFTAPRWRGTR